MNLSHDKANNNINNKSNINNQKYIYNSLTHQLEPMLKNNNNNEKLNRANLVYVKPKINSINKYNFKSPISHINENNYNSLPNTELINNKKNNLILNLNSLNKDEKIRKSLSPSYLSPVNNNSQNIIFNKRYSNYSNKNKGKKNNGINNNLFFDERASTPIPTHDRNNYVLNIGYNSNEDIKENNILEIEYNEQMKNCGQFDNCENTEKSNLKTNINNEKLLQYNKLKLQEENNILEYHEELDNINPEEKIDLNNEDNSEKINEQIIKLNIEKINDIENKKDKEDNIEEYNEKKILSQRITEEIKEEKAEDEEDSEKNKSNINEKNDNTNKKELKQINAENKIREDKKSGKKEDSNNIEGGNKENKYEEETNKSGYNYDNNDSIEIINDVDKFANENNQKKEENE